MSLRVQGRLLFVFLLCAQPLLAQSPQIAIIDFYSRVVRGLLRGRGVPPELRSAATKPASGPRRSVNLGFFL